MKRPNLLFIFADQWRRQALGVMKQDPVKTPHMDAFAADSLVLGNAVSANPLCSPHRACLFTGKYSTGNGVFTNCKPGLLTGLREDETCLSDMLKKAGYDTAYIGKWHLDAAEENFSPSPVSGARGWDAYTPPGPKRHSFDYWYSYGTYDEHLHPHYWQDTPEMIRHNGWSVTHETDKALDYLKNHSPEKPFALVLSWNPPHNPYELVPPEYRVLYRNEDFRPRPNTDISKGYLHCHTSTEQLPFTSESYRDMVLDYFAAVSGLDYNFGCLISYLKKSGQYDDTIIVLSSDHGDMMGSHGLLAKHVWYEESIGIPFVIRWGSRLRKGTDSTLMNSPDVMPTLLGLMGLPVPPDVQGTDISAHLSGQTDAPVTAALCQSMPGSPGAITRIREAGQNPMDFGWRALRTRTHTYVADRGYVPGLPVRRLLYDNVNDPYQLEPLTIRDIRTNETAAHCERTMKTLMRKAGDSFPLGVQAQ